jgi:hypothetical protein
VDVASVADVAGAGAGDVAGVAAGAGAGFPQLPTTQQKPSMKPSLDAAVARIPNLYQIEDTAPEIP